MKTDVFETLSKGSMSRLSEIKHCYNIETVNYI